MPHLTEVPPNYVELKRGVAPLPWPYSLYSTYYGVEKKGGPTDSVGPGIPGVELTVDFNSTVDAAPGRLKYPAAPAGKKVKLDGGVTATLVTSSGTAEVVWRYPTSGVPRYLQGVATVTVSGTMLPAATVLAIARQVKPD